MELRIRVHFPRKCVFDPYRPERGRVIDIEKESGMVFYKTPEKRDAALRAQLSKERMPFEEYASLKQTAEQPFDFFDGGGEIIIPSEHVEGCLREAASKCPPAVRVAPKEAICCVLSSSPWRTGKAEADALIWERMVVANDGSGRRISNQRRLERHYYLADFDATGTLYFAGDVAQLPRLRDFLGFAGGPRVGIGASRKLGHGRFEVVNLEPA